VLGVEFCNRTVRAKHFPSGRHGSMTLHLFLGGKCELPHIPWLTTATLDRRTPVPIRQATA
jgi:hypothetical protein